MYYTYMLRCADNSIYTGITTDVRRRFAEHSGQIPGKCAKYTGSRKALKIEAVWLSYNRQTASVLEYRIKQLKKADKEKLIIQPQFFKIAFDDKINISDYERIGFFD